MARELPPICPSSQRLALDGGRSSDQTGVVTTLYSKATPAAPADIRLSIYLTPPSTFCVEMTYSR